MVIRDETDEFLDEETQQVTFILRLTALFVAEHRQMETKHSLVDTQNYGMLKTNEKRWFSLKFLTKKIQFSTF